MNGQQKQTIQDSRHHECSSEVRLRVSFRQKGVKACRVAPSTCEGVNGNGQILASRIEADREASTVAFIHWLCSYECRGCSTEVLCQQLVLLKYLTSPLLSATAAYDCKGNYTHVPLIPVKKINLPRLGSCCLTCSHSFLSGSLATAYISRLFCSSIFLRILSLQSRDHTCPPWIASGLLTFEWLAWVLVALRRLSTLPFLCFGTRILQYSWHIWARTKKYPQVLLWRLPGGCTRVRVSLITSFYVGNPVAKLISLGVVSGRANSGLLVFQVLFRSVVLYPLSPRFKFISSLGLSDIRFIVSCQLFRDVTWWGLHPQDPESCDKKERGQQFCVAQRASRLTWSEDFPINVLWQWLVVEEGCQATKNKVQGRLQDMVGIDVLSLRRRVITIYAGAMRLYLAQASKGVPAVFDRIEPHNCRPWALIYVHLSRYPVWHRLVLFLCNSKAFSAFNSIFWGKDTKLLVTWRVSLINSLKTSIPWCCSCGPGKCAGTPVRRNQIQNRKIRFLFMCITRANIYHMCVTAENYLPLAQEGSSFGVNPWF